MKKKKNNNEEKPAIDIFKINENQIIIRGKKLNYGWLDSCIVIWSKEEHKYK